MLNKIAVHRNPVLIGIKVNPVWLYIHNAVTLLQNQNIACNLRACVSSKSVVGKSDRPQKLGSLGDIFPHFGACLVHRSFGSDEHHNAARAYLIQSLCEKVIVDKEFLGVVAAVIHLKLTKRHIAKYHIKVTIWQLRVLKSLHGNVRFLVELPCNPARQRVDFHAEKIADCHTIGEKPEEIACAAGWLQDISLRKAQTVKGFVHRLNDNGRRIKSGQRRLFRRTVFLWGEACVKLHKLVCPRCVILVKRH